MVPFNTYLIRLIALNGSRHFVEVRGPGAPAPPIDPALRMKIETRSNRLKILRENQSRTKFGCIFNILNSG